ncbi:hypothetical protein J5Y03_15050 [Bacillus sp. RG28]|uniref:Uncharacterized protein n=1 Tax=Gottfriedia endophytica TaxID=2820819 RepID=A0A940NLL1_9BACI|nr:hypothetical protein [Gottfriedia endophytica]MBP0726477.1 hypothetical protein [Gottfriedia endophytica]
MGKAKAINMISFFLLLVCLSLFLLVATSHESLLFLKKLLGFHPLNAVLVLSFLTILISLIGFTGAFTWKGKFRSLFSLMISLSLSIFVSVVL